MTLEDIDPVRQSYDALLPKNVGFAIGNMIGRGAFAVVNLCHEKHSSNKPFAVKFIHKQSAERIGRVSRFYIIREITLLKECSKHPNIVSYLGHGEDSTWIWLKMKAAMGGDLFDKIEPDVGMHDDICQLYFQQLVAAVEFIHSKGISHRDIKPENILLDADGNLLLSDFGFATLYSYKGQTKLSSTICGSPPYVAPEILKHEYNPALSDMWSCGVVLFAMLCGCTPWDYAGEDNLEFAEYVMADGNIKAYPWNAISPAALSLVRSLMKVNPEKRISFSNVRTHPWFTRPNRLISGTGKCSDPLELAERLILNLRIDIDGGYKSTQKFEDIPVTERVFGSNSQPTTINRNCQIQAHRYAGHSMQYQYEFSAPLSQPIGHDFLRATLYDSLAEDISVLQFSQHRQEHIPESLTQRARRFYDICPSTTLNKFYSTAPISQLISILGAALHRLGTSVPLESIDINDSTRDLWLRVTVPDRRRCLMSGTIKCQVLDNIRMVEVVFEKSKADLLEWRTFFKRVVSLCKEVVFTGA
ncbi:kinase-like domain-containing protein [Dipodascopsis uninucleata]